MWLSMSGALVGSLVGCGLGGLGGGGGSGNGDLDPLNPPPPPFPDDPFPNDGTCGDLNAVVNGVTPTVQLLIDQSGSMEERFGGTDRWNAVYDTLMGPDGVVSQLAPEVRFGLSLYTSYNGNEGCVCPVLTEVAPALDNYAAMDAKFRPASPQADTPTGESIDAIVPALRSLNVPGPKIIVLGRRWAPEFCS
jgi:hypothetical protein